jgi:PAS domain S-box-containing protein
MQEGKVVGLQGIAHDITDRKRAEEALAEEKRRLSYILEGTNVGTWEWNIQTGERIYNERWAEIIGYTLEELAPISTDTRDKFTHPDDVRKSKELVEKHFNKELEYYECETRMRHKNGSWVWVLDRGKVATWTNDGKPLTMSGTHQDITKRKHAEEALRKTIEEREKLIKELQSALDNVKTLQGLIPICASCKKIRDDKGFWNQVEGYISEHTDAKFTHGICPDCAKELYGDVYDKVNEDQKKKNT